MNISKHFTLEELVGSPTAKAKGIDNSPSNEILANLRVLAATLEAVRSLVNKPISVSSAYRCKALNKAIGGASNSAHVEGLAADINIAGYTPNQLCKAIISSGIPFDQLIEEPSWVHIGLSKGTLRNQVLTAKMVNGKMTYSKGII